MDRKRSEALYSEACTLMPGGVNSPVRAFKSVGGTPIFMKQGTGARLTDEDDNTYIDYCMSWGPLILGHGDEDVTAAVLEAARMGTSFGTPNRHEVELSRLVVKKYPSIERLRFVNSGTEAVMSAVRCARGFTGRNKIVKFDGCYHGHADYLLVAAGSGLATLGAPDSAGVTPQNARDTLVVPFNDLDALTALVDKEHDSIACIIMEPVPCNYGLIVPLPGFLSGVRELCDRYGILLICDEVITGFRLAPGGAQEYYGIRADITTLGKIIGGGLPVGAYGASEEIMNTVAPLGPVYQAGTLSGNPVAMAAGAATLKKLEELNAYTLLQKKADYFHEQLSPALDKYKGRFLCTQLGSIFSFTFTSLPEILTVDEVHAADMEAFSRFHHEMLKRGIYLSPSGYEVGFISTAHTEEELKQTANAVGESLEIIF